MILRVPAGGIGLVVDPLGGGACNGLAIGSNALHVAVSRDGRDNSKSCEDSSSAGGIHLDRHIDCGSRKGWRSVCRRSGDFESERMSRSTVSGE